VRHVLINNGLREANTEGLKGKEENSIRHWKKRDF
jgi:hypothetical protein